MEGSWKVASHLDRGGDAAGALSPSVLLRKEVNAKLHVPSDDVHLISFLGTRQVVSEAEVARSLPKVRREERSDGRGRR